MTTTDYVYDAIMEMAENNAEADATVRALRKTTEEPEE